MSMIAAEFKHINMNTFFSCKIKVIPTFFSGGTIFNRGTELFGLYFNRGTPLRHQFFGTTAKQNRKI